MPLRPAPLLSTLSLALAALSPATSAGPIGTSAPERMEAAAAAETLYTGGTILTMVGDTPRTVEALGVAGGRIVHAGPLGTARRTASTQVVDLKGKTLLPGFIDTHGHFIYFGKNLIDADLFGASTVDRPETPCSATPASPNWMRCRPIDP